jgi:hypothetical protein
LNNFVITFSILHISIANYPATKEVVVANAAIILQVIFFTVDFSLSFIYLIRETGTFFILENK